MKNKKLYQIIKADCIVIRKGGIKEIETFSFIYDINFYLHKTVGISISGIYKELLDKQIQFYNEYCPDDFVIKKYEVNEFIVGGEIWL